MQFSVDWNLVYENPFTISPPTNPKQVIWAGLKELGEFKSVFREAKTSAPTQGIMPRGYWGRQNTRFTFF